MRPEVTLNKQTKKDFWNIPFLVGDIKKEAIHLYLISQNAPKMAMGLVLSRKKLKVYF